MSSTIRAILMYGYGMMDMDGGNPDELFELFGGQGTINVPNWSPGGDSLRLRSLEPKVEKSAPRVL